MFKLTHLIVLLSVLCVVAIAAPYQELPPRRGYVPVYIREGNTPLHQINPKLVEAFKEDEQSNQLQVENEKQKEEPEAAVNDEVDKTPEKKQQDKEDETKAVVKTTEDDSNMDNKQNNETEFEEEKDVVEVEPASDIAEFTSDDVKSLANDKIDN